MVRTDASIRGSPGRLRDSVASIVSFDSNSSSPLRGPARRSRGFKRMSTHDEHSPTPDTPPHPGATVLPGTVSSPTESVRDRSGLRQVPPSAGAIESWQSSVGAAERRLTLSRASSSSTSKKGWMGSLKRMFGRKTSTGAAVQIEIDWVHCVVCEGRVLCTFTFVVCHCVLCTFSKGITHVFFVLMLYELLMLWIIVKSLSIARKCFCYKFLVLHLVYLHDLHIHGRVYSRSGLSFLNHCYFHRNNNRLYGWGDFLKVYIAYLETQNLDVIQPQSNCGTKIVRCWDARLSCMAKRIRRLDFSRCTVCVVHPFEYPPS